MLRQVLTLYSQFAREHVDISSSGFMLMDENGVFFGYLDRVRLQKNRLVVEGWTEAARVSLIQHDHHRTTVPNLSRTDVHAAYPQLNAPNPGFWLDIPFQPGSAFVAFEMGSSRYIYTVDPFQGPELRNAALRLVPRYLWVLMRGLPAYLHWRVTRHPASRARLKALFGFGTIEIADQIQASLLADPVEDPSPTRPPDAPVTIILPVYNAFDVLPEVLDRVAAHTDLPWHLILIEDASSDPKVRPFLRDWASGQPQGRVELIENKTNLGFIRSVNRGFAQALKRGDHVILLNSDALVPPGWASRLMRPVLDAPDKVATVTPVSNDAEILSVPVIAMRSSLRPGEADRIDALAASFSQQAATTVIPTGVGFCMAMNISRLKAIPAFDTKFGRGYGEEVDWCQKVRAHGGQHLAHTGLFVEHRGGTSFGSSDKLKLVARNNATISGRYPRYDAEIQDFIRSDPLATARLALAIGWAAGRAGDQELPLYVAHALGGGAEDYLTARIAGDVGREGAHAKAALVLRVGTADRWRLEVHTSQGVTRGATDDLDLVQRLLRPVPSLCLIYSCGVGDRDSLELPNQMLSLLRGPKDRAEALFNDYLPISPSYTLLDSDGIYRGLPDPASADRAHSFRRPDGSQADLATWQAAWGGFLARCDRIVTFSENSRALVVGAYPETAARIVVAPHKMLVDVAPCPAPPRGKRPVVGVLGNIGQQKGAGVVSDLSRSFAQSGAADLVLIGNIDPSFPLAPQTRVHGTYDRRDLPELVARYGISCWLIPSIWPETFSYTTHECIATGLPVWTFDLGAQGDAVRAAAAESGRGGILPLTAGRPKIDGLTEKLIAEIGHPNRSSSF